MRVLFTNRMLAKPAGTETQTYALAVELKRLGHEVCCYSPVLGMTAERLGAAGIQVRDKLQFIDKPSVIHGQHAEAVRAAQFFHVPWLFVCHGPEHELERPPAGANAYVAVSPEVARMVPDASIIANSIDLERFAFCPTHTKPKKVLRLSHHTDGVPVWDVERLISGADIVVTIGRGVLEAAAMGKCVVVSDRGRMDGLLTADNFTELASCNFSGRRYGFPETPESLALQIAMYEAANLQAIRERVCAGHDVKAAALRYVALYEQAVANGVH